MQTRKYYKYLSVDLENHKNKERIERIFNENQLYAATFNELNDPLEGRLPNVILNSVDKFIKAKSNSRICSLTTINNCELMWAHYAKNHTGIVLEVELVESNNNKIEIEDITYVDYLPFKFFSSEYDMARFILKHKKKTWSYENEVRVITNETYVKVKINKIYTSYNVGVGSNKFIKDIAKQKNLKVENFSKEMFYNEYFSNYKIGSYAQQLFRSLDEISLNKILISNLELHKFKLLIKVSDVAQGNIRRYYKTPIKINSEDYLICNHWFEDDFILLNKIRELIF